MERVIDIDPDINRTAQQMQMMDLMNDEDYEGEGYDSGDDNDDDDDDDEQVADRIFDEKISFAKRPQCVQESARKALQDEFDARIHAGATVKHKNKAVVKKALDLIVNADSLDSSPIVFRNVTVSIFVAFLHSRARKKGREYLSKSGSNSYRSAFKELHRQCKAKVDDEFEKELSLKLKCLHRGYAAEKEKRGGRLAEGKDPMSFKLYKYLCKKMVEDKDKKSIFAHAFLTMTWNLMCRSKNTVHIHLNHITFGTDSLCIRFAHTKTDVEGGDKARIRHVFANPYNLDICAVTALGKYLSFFPPKEDGKLFDNKSYKRFQKYLKTLVCQNVDEVKRMGFDPKDIGVHSIRKGAATYCCAGTTAAPHIAAICNRAGWTMGKVKDTYIQHGDAGDQHVGRVVAGLPVLKSTYAVSPPFFRIDDREEFQERTVTSEDVDYIISTVYSLYEKTITFKPVPTACAAALIYAKEYLEQNMHENAPLRGSTLFIMMTKDQILQKASLAVQIAHAWDECPYFDSNELTGIPSYVIQFVNHEKMTDLVNTRFDEQNQKIIYELDQRQLGGELTPAFLRQSILEPLQAKFDDKFDQLKRDLMQRKESDETNVDNSKSFAWSNDNLPHALPEDYKVRTSITPLTMWICWHHGDTVASGAEVGPLKNIPTSEFPGSRNTNNYASFCRMKKFYKDLDSLAGITADKTPTVQELNSLYIQNVKKWREENGILLPELTPTGRKRKRGENGWDYICRQYFNRKRCEIKAREQGRSVDEILNEAYEKEKERQRRKRLKAKEKKQASLRTNTESPTPNVPRENVVDPEQYGLNSIDARRLGRIIT